MTESGSRVSLPSHPVGIAAEASLACLVTRKLPGSRDHEFGAHAYGPAAATVAARLTSGIRAWDRHGRDLPDDAFTWYPADTTPPPPDSQAMSFFPRRHGTRVITWPPARPAERPAAGQAAE
jgi:protein-L-isoaspartate(D-aspartate) O-methyltransferase